MMTIVPISLDEANAFVREHHRHHKPVPGAKFCVAVESDGAIVGVAVVGRPIARMIDDDWTRGEPDMHRRHAQREFDVVWSLSPRGVGLGYRRLLTYTLPSESGDSLQLLAGS